MIIRDRLESLLGKEIKVIVDRPIGSTHPEHPEIVYPINYGYYPEIKAADGEYQDVYILNENKPVKEYTGTVVAIVERKRDIEDKLIVADKPVTRLNIDKSLRFIERFHSHKIKLFDFND